MFLPSPAVIRRILPLSAVSGPFQMLYLCIVFERPKLRVRVLTIFPTCTSKISYVYPHPGPLRHKSSLTLLTGRPIVPNLSHTDLTDLTNPHGSILVPKTSKNSKETKIIIQMVLDLCAIKNVCVTFKQFCAFCAICETF